MILVWLVLEYFLGVARVVDTVRVGLSHMLVGWEMLDTFVVVERVDDGNCNELPEVAELHTIQRLEDNPCIGCCMAKLAEEMMCSLRLHHQDSTLQKKIRHCVQL